MQSNWAVWNVGDIDQEHFLLYGSCTIKYAVFSFCFHWKQSKTNERYSFRLNATLPRLKATALQSTEIWASNSTHSLTHSHTNSIHCQLNVKHTRIWLPPVIYCLTRWICQNRQSIRFGHWKCAFRNRQIDWKRWTKQFKTIKLIEERVEKQCHKNELIGATGFDFIKREKHTQKNHWLSEL